MLGRYYDNYGIKQTINYRKIMMDSNGTYEFKMTNIYGTPSMMVNVGPMNSVIDIGNDGSYQYARISLDVNETLTIPLNPPITNMDTKARALSIAVV